jgi:glucokinase
MFASVDVSGLNTHCALATRAGDMLAERTIPTEAHQGAQTVLGRIADTIDLMASEAGGRVLAMGVGLPGLTDFHRGRALFLPNLPGHWRDVPVAEILATRVNCPAFVLNDARMAALGELWYGHGRTVKTMVFLTIGTGIGGGVVIDRKLRLGPLGAAGEIGHQTILPDGPPCGCGNRGCLEALASGPALIGEGVRLMTSGQAPHLREMIAGDASRITPANMAQAAAAGDSAVRGAIVRAGRFLGIGIANVITVLNPELVVLGSEVAVAGELLVDTIKREVRDRVRMLPIDRVRIEISMLKDRAALWGGLALAIARAAKPAGHAVSEGIEHPDATVPTGVLGR